MNDVPPSNQTPDLFKVIDINKLKPLLEHFNRTSGLAVSLTDLENRPIFRCRHGSVCERFFRSRPASLERCDVSAASLSQRLDRGAGVAFETCGNGLVHAAASIVIHGKRAGNLFLGQFFLAPPRPERFR
ncbi:MAG TPA: PocR ligand-binding domain-containing protein, partial [Candidatus Bathyarchaeia archaeon]|nr:PocR ligand-binding domain-containing protein [Candidatus Bathyarchaeia archaeon]